MRRGRAFTAALVLLLAVSCAKGRPEGSAIVVGLINSPVNLDPRVGTDEASQKAHQLLYSTLLRIDNDLNVVPELAESFVPESDTTYVARLRRGVLFHNGRELTADDVVYTFRSFLDPTFRGRSGAYRLLKSVNARDPYTVEFNLSEPFASFPVNLVMGIVQAGSGAANARSPIGTGPYKLSYVRSGRSPRARARSTSTTAAGLGTTASSSRWCRTTRCAASSCARARSTSSSTTCRPTSSISCVTKAGSVSPTAAGSDYAYVGINLKDPVLGNLKVRQATRVRHRSAGDRRLPAPRLRARRRRHPAADVVGVRAARLRLHARPAARTPAARRGRLPRSGWRRAEAALPPDAQDLDVGDLPRAGGGAAARSGARRDRRGRQVERAADAVRRRAARGVPALHAAMGRRDRSRTCSAASITRSRRRRPASIACTTAMPTSIG